MFFALLAASIAVGAAFLFLLIGFSLRAFPRRRDFLFPAIFVALGLLCSWLGTHVLPTWSHWSSKLLFKALTSLGSAASEEILKTGVWITAASCLRSLRNPRDGLLQGASLGLGFALGENILFALVGGWQTWLLRTVISLPGHIAYGAAWGGFWSWAQSTHQRERRDRLAVFLSVWSLVVGLHALYNLVSAVHFPLVALLSLDGFAWALALASSIVVWTDEPASRQQLQGRALKPVI